MKKTLFALALILSLSNAYSSTFVGRTGPFYKNEFSEHSLKVKKCNTNWSSLLLVAKANGKHSFPRYAFREITIEYASGKTQYIKSANESESLKRRLIKVRANDCIKSISLNAMNTGMNPGQLNILEIEVWAQK